MQKIAIHKAISELDSCIQNLDNIAFTSIKNKTDDTTKIENKHMNLYYDHKQNAIIKMILSPKNIFAIIQMMNHLYKIFVNYAVS